MNRIKNFLNLQQESQLTKPLKPLLNQGNNHKSNTKNTWLRYISPLQPKPLKIWGFNVRSLKKISKQEQFLEVLKQKNNRPDIVLMNETWLKKDNAENNAFTEDEDYFLLASDFDQTYQGTAILVKKSLGAINATQIISSNKNLTEVKVNIDPENTFSFVSIYVPPDGDLARDLERDRALQVMVELFEKDDKKTNFIAYSDINTRLREKDAKQSRIQTDQILNYFEKNDVELIYSENEKDFTRKGSESYIDFFFQRGLKHKKFAIKDDPIDSDHLLLEILVEPSTPKKNIIWGLFLIGMYIKFCMGEEHEIVNKIKKELENLEAGNKQSKDDKINKNKQNTKTQQQSSQQQQNRQSKALDIYIFIGFMYAALYIMFKQQYIARMAQQVVRYVWGMVRY